MNDLTTEVAQAKMVLRGVQVEYLICEDEGHGFRKRANRIMAVEAYVDFLDRFLRYRSRLRRLEFRALPVYTHWQGVEKGELDAPTPTHGIAGRLA